MAVNNETKMTTATSRRLFFGANVIVVVLLAVIVLAGINYIGHRKNVRKDLAGGLASHRLSERSKSILDQYPEELTITTVYTSDEPDSNRKEYLPRLQDYLEEVSQHKRNVSVQHLYNGDQRFELRQRVQGKFGEAAEKYKEVIDSTQLVWDDLRGIMQALQVASREQLQGQSWLSGFTTLANIEAVLRKDLEEIEETRRAVDDLVGDLGIPKYQEANNRIKTSNDNFKQHLETVQTWMRDTDKLVKVLSQADSDFAAKSKENLAVLQGLLLNMHKAVGDPDDREIPEDPVPMIQAYGKAANALSKWLFDEYTRVSAFVKENPGLEQHPKWTVRVQVAIFEQNVPLHELLTDTAQQLDGNVQVVRRLLADPSKVDELTLKNVAAQLRQNAPQVEKMLAVWSNNLSSVLADAANIDENSKRFLARGVSGEFFRTASAAGAEGESAEAVDIIARLTELNSKIEDLPKLELDEIADRMKEDNIVVIETAKAVRVVPFDEVWPAAAPENTPMGEERTKLYRVFDGDRAISSAVNTLMASKKVATVILTAFETAPPPQMRQMQQRPNTGPIPLAQMTVLKDRLEKANFAVKEWNLGGENAEPPAPEEGTEAIYVFLPPAEAPPPNPMMQQAPPPSFGPQQMEQVKKVLAEGGRGVFLAFGDAMPRRMPWEPQPSYAYADMLRSDWGIDVRFDHRVVRGVRNPQRPDHFDIDILQWSFMPLNYFTDHPIGAPLKARRLLMAEVCPVVQADAVPEGVKISPVLEVPASAQDVWAERDISRIFQGLREGKRDASFTKSPEAMDDGFSVMVAAENEATKSRVVVMGMGFSFIDAFISRPVPRLEARKAVTLSTDPPPLENADLALNTMYWLADQPNMIAAGPALVPLVGQIDPSNQKSAWFISVGWAFAVLILGSVVMFVRRK